MNPLETEIGEKCLEIFAKIAGIPHPSHGEERISRFIFDYCTSLGLETVRDEVGNVIAEIPPSPGFENRPRVILQAHMDMVAVAAADRNFNPAEDGIRLIQKGDFLVADGTSLGADDGIGVAMILALAEAENFAHGPIRGIFTVDEEDGMAGVARLDRKYLADSKYLINLDSEESDTLTNSCAGGVGVDFVMADRAAAPTLDFPLNISVDGILGGHSGTMIGERRINGNIALCRFLGMLSDSGIEYELANFRGGTARNAIPPIAKAKILVDSWDRERVSDLADTFENEMKSEYAESDGGFNIDISGGSLPKSIIGSAAADSLISLACRIVNGVYSMSQKVDGLVESSSNLGIINATPEQIYLNAFARSSEADKLSEISALHVALGEKLGFAATLCDRSDAWPVRENSLLLDSALRVYREQNGEDMKVLAIHAGLECGAFARMNPELDMISIGPDVTGAHSPKEKLFIPSVGKIARLVMGIMLDL